MLIKSIRLENLLSFGPDTAPLEMKPLSVLIGPNGFGKSNLIEAIGLLQAAPRNLPASISAGGGIGDWIWRGEPSAPAAKVEVIVDNPKGPQALRYILGIWNHLESRDGWDRPPGADEENSHLMVQCMESWFLADKEVLAAFFGGEFKLNTLSANASIEEISKQDVLQGLKKATRECEKKGEYGKGQHSFEILALLNPERVINASPHAERLIHALRQRADN